MSSLPSPEDTLLVRESWKKIADKGVMNTVNFYDSLFENTPSARGFFPEDLSRLSEKFNYTIDFIVTNSDRLEEIKYPIEDLGRIHNKLKIDESYYPKLTEAIIHTLKKSMGEEYRSEMSQAWQNVIEYISAIMLAAPPKKENGFQKLLHKLFG